MRKSNQISLRDLLNRRLSLKKSPCASELFYKNALLPSKGLIEASLIVSRICGAQCTGWPRSTAFFRLLQIKSSAALFARSKPEARFKFGLRQSSALEKDEREASIKRLQLTSKERETLQWPATQVEETSHALLMQMTRC